MVASVPFAPGKERMTHGLQLFGRHRGLQNGAHRIFCLVDVGSISGAIPVVRGAAGREVGV